MHKRFIIAALLLIAGAASLWFLGRPAYRRHKETRFIEQARQYLAKGDPRNASLSARQAYQINPHNLAACQIMAELAEKSRSPHLLDWRRRIAELAPTLENKLLLASAALRVQAPPCPLAAQTLEEIAPAGTNVPAYHVVAAELALKLRNIADAESHFEAAGRLDPTNELHQLNLAVLRLQSTNAALAAQAE